MQREIIDQLNRKLSLSNKPQRIISLVPSLTELLYHLDLEQQVVGITKFCVHPDHWFRQKTRIGGTKNVHYHLIDQLQPDLIIANKEENRAEDIRELEKRYPVYVTDINTLPQAISAIEEIGIITDRSVQANKINIKITQAFDALPFPNAYMDALYLIWKNPYMSVGNDTFIHDMLESVGFKNVLENRTRYPEITVEEIVALQPQVVLLSSEPFPFDEKHLNEIEKLLPDAHILLVDGEMFSWYGARLLYAPAYFRKIQEMVGLDRYYDTDMH
ncbi:helical backbone metal receptor [Gynurincola endophyticus]|uniref:helical backbone metal receptor n=1 Tax=Gynurincola endophyticus TaxID=2479004 RepID=UPI000F8CFCF0|nr:helical backbone metal receptor [Gynurincola endophyticus]